MSGALRAGDHLAALEGAPADTVVRAARALEALLIPLVNAGAGVVVIFGYICADAPEGAWIDTEPAEGAVPRIDYWLPDEPGGLDVWIELALVQVCQRFRVRPALRARA